MIRDTTIAINSRLLRQLRLAAEILGHDCAETALEVIVTERLQGMPYLAEAEEDLRRYWKTTTARLKAQHQPEPDNIP